MGRRAGVCSSFSKATGRGIGGGGGLACYIIIGLFFNSQCNETSIVLSYP